MNVPFSLTTPASVEALTEEPSPRRVRRYARLEGEVTRTVLDPVVDLTTEDLYHKNLLKEKWISGNIWTESKSIAKKELNNIIIIIFIIIIIIIIL